MRNYNYLSKRLLINFMLLILLCMCFSYVNADGSDEAEDEHEQDKHVNRPTTAQSIFQKLFFSYTFL